MTEPQVWTLIGVFAAGLFGMITLMSTMFVRIIKTEIGSVRTEIGSVRTEIRSVRTEIRSEIGSVRGEIGSLRSEMQSEFRGVHQRIDRLDSDVDALMKHTFGIQRD